MKISPVVCRFAFAAGLALSGCTTTQNERPGEDHLFHVLIERREIMWSDWDFHIDTNNAWYTDDGYAALPISENLTITGDWYDPAKATRRKTLEVVASTGMLFPPNFLFMAGLWPDKRCRGTLFYTFRAKTKYRVTGAALDGAITLSLYPADDGQVLANAVCEPS